MSSVFQYIYQLERKVDEISNQADDNYIPEIYQRHLLKMVNDLANVISYSMSFSKTEKIFLDSNLHQLHLMLVNPPVEIQQIKELVSIVKESIFENAKRDSHN